MSLSFLIMAKLLGATRNLLFASYFILSFCLIYTLLTHNLNAIEMTLIALSLMLALLHHYLSIRVKFDSDLLLMLYEQFSIDPTAQVTLTQQLDQTLVNLGLMPPEKINRKWDLRFKGCLKLLKIQTLILIIQMTLLFVLICI